MISVQNLSKQFGEQVIFDGITFTINAKERIGLVGRNGHGKSTLFSILTGQEHYDGGSVVIPKNYRIGFLTQELNFTAKTVLEEGCLGLQEAQAGETWRVKKILAGLGFSEEDFNRSLSDFSGGFQVRLNLAKVLVAEPNLLLLDEPTNFLDIVSIRWLIRFLNAWPNELMVISHDRGFMDSVATHIMGIHRCKIKKLKGETKAYYDQIALEEELHEKKRIGAEKKHKQMEQFINRFRAKARQANLVQSRIKTLEKQEKLERLDKIPTLSFSFNAAPCEAKYLLEAKNLRFSYAGKAPYLIDNFSMTVQNRDRICIVGKNGKGKTTLMKLLAEVLAPQNGSARYHPKAKPGYFEQANTVILNNDTSVEQEIIQSHPVHDRKAARDICGAMMFTGDHALKKIGVLSGGEKCRVLLGKLLVTPANILLLDEPTHHLDMLSCEAMMEAINEFDGAVIVVTHNERILKHVANKLVVFHQERLFVFQGGYTDFLEKGGWDDEEGIACGKKGIEGDRKKGLTKRGMRKARATFFSMRSKTLTPLKQAMDRLERTIEALEKQEHDDTEALVKASQENDRENIEKFSKTLPDLRERIGKRYDDLENTHEKYEKAKQKFDKEESE
jgi:ATP-binding cassette subfamily F protein 3